jgi:anti-anti-sigma regulatory factor
LSQPEQAQKQISSVCLGAQSNGLGCLAPGERRVADLRANTETLLNAVDGSGDWIAPEEFRDLALAALERDADVRIPVGSVEHLDASALQILTALASELNAVGHTLALTGPGPALRSWFAYAGATELLSPEGGSPNAPLEVAGR